MLSTIADILPDAFAPAVSDTVTCSSTKSGRPACSASVNTAGNPPKGIGFGASKPGQGCGGLARRVLLSMGELNCRKSYFPLSQEHSSDVRNSGPGLAGTTMNRDTTHCPPESATTSRAVIQPQSRW